TLTLVTGLAIFMNMSAMQGDVALAANQVLLQFLFITAYAMDGFAFAAESLVGQAMGIRNRALVRRAAVMAGLWGGATVGALAILFAIIGPWVIDLMTTARDVRDEALKFLFYIVLAPPLGCAAWVFDGIFIGATRTRDMRNMMCISFLIYCAAASVLVPAFDNHGLWQALILSFVARGITLGLRYPSLEAAADRAAPGG
ncbi:MAG: MATE family efflux transporter, partial [Rhodobacteraceae bacterium]|nr:MATE family efflux transporter [Paracoccaceae bacterium]